MEPIHPLLTTQRSLRYTAPVLPLLEDLSLGGQLYVHARNWMAELASITPLTGLVVDDEQTTAMFPEIGLSLALDAIECMHGIAIEHRSRPALALEIATRGEPRAVSFAAIPEFSDLDHFWLCLNRHPSEVLTDEVYQEWRTRSVVCPSICPCCAAAATERRSHPERNPLTRIICHAIEHALPLRCSVVSRLFGYSAWLTPKNLQLSGGLLGVIGDDGKAMLEVDLGMCYSMRISRRKIDAEEYSVIQLFDSAGNTHLKIAAPGWEAEGIWRGFCQGDGRP